VDKEGGIETGGREAAASVPPEGTTAGGSCEVTVCAPAPSRGVAVCAPGCAVAEGCSVEGCCVDGCCVEGCCTVGACAEGWRAIGWGAIDEGTPSASDPGEAAPGRAGSAEPCCVCAASALASGGGACPATAVPFGTGMPVASAAPEPGSLAGATVAAGDEVGRGAAPPAAVEPPPRSLAPVAFIVGTEEPDAATPFAEAPLRTTPAPGEALFECPSGTADTLAGWAPPGAAATPVADSTLVSRDVRAGEVAPGTPSGMAALSVAPFDAAAPGAPGTPATALPAGSFSPVAAWASGAPAACIAAAAAGTPGSRASPETGVGVAFVAPSRPPASASRR
jgi:hypothetical protein